MNSCPIGIFDSGLGGLTVVRQLLKLLPQEDIVYFGDTGRVPYGSRSPETITRYAREDCRLLLEHNVKAIIAACGTVSSVAPDVLSSLPVPAMGVVKPTADAALAATKNKKIGILGTTATVRSGAFMRRLTERDPAVSVVARECPLFVSLVESGWIEPDNEATVAVARRYLQPLIEEKVDTVILGCTHFPLLSPILSSLLGEGVTLIDSGAATAAAFAAMLEKNDLSAPSDRTGSCRFFVSDQPHGFAAVAQMFLGREVGDTVTRVDPERSSR